MKQIMYILIAIIVCTVMCSAQNYMVQNRVETKLMTHNVVGLDNAMLRAENSTASKALEQVMEKIQTRNRERLNRLTDMIIEKNDKNEIVASGNTYERFLGLLKIQRRLEFRISEDGNIERVSRWTDRFFVLEA